MTLQGLHRGLAAGLSLFILPHLLGHLGGLAGPAGFDRSLALMRPLYRHPLVEAVLLFAVVAQALLGLWLIWRRGRRGWRPGLPRWQSLSGLIVALFILQHIPALVVARWGAGLETGFWWPASVAGTWPLSVYFWPYYLLGVMAFVLHLGLALALGLRRRGRPAAGRAVIWGAGLLAPMWAVAILAGISGVLHPYDLPAEWQAFAAALLPG